MFRSKMMTVLMLVLAGGLFAACKTGTATPPPQIFTTDAYQPLNLNARRLEIIDNWQMPVARSIYWASGKPIAKRYSGRLGIACASSCWWQRRDYF